MVVRLLVGFALLAACESAPPGAAESQPAAFTRTWQASADPGLRIQDCLLKVELPNPEYPSDHQDLIRRVFSSRATIDIPIYFTYSYNNATYVILNSRCSRNVEFTRALESYLHQNSRLQRYRVSIANTDEASDIVTMIERMAGQARE